MSASDMAMYSIADTDFYCRRDYNYTTQACNQTQLEPYVTLLRRDMVEIQIYFDELIHEDIKTIKAYSLLALFCDIGGAMGLILGSTVLTVFELMDFSLVALYDSVYMFIMKKKVGDKSGNSTAKLKA